MLLRVEIYPLFKLRRNIMENITKGILNGIKITGATTLFVVTLSICSKIIAVTVKSTINVFKKED